MLRRVTVRNTAVLRRVTMRPPALERYRSFMKLKGQNPASGQVQAVQPPQLVPDPRESGHATHAAMLER